MQFYSPGPCKGIDRRYQRFAGGNGQNGPCKLSISCGNIRAMHEKPNRPKLSGLPPIVRDVIRSTAEMCRVTPEAILDGRKTGETAKARGLICRKLVAEGFTQGQIGKWLGIHH